MKDKKFVMTKKKRMTFYVFLVKKVGDAKSLCLTSGEFDDSHVCRAKGHMLQVFWKIRQIPQPRNPSSSNFYLNSYVH